MRISCQELIICGISIAKSLESDLGGGIYENQEKAKRKFTFQRFVIDWMSQPIHRAVTAAINLSDQTAIELALPIPRHDAPAHFLQRRFRIRVGFEPVRKNQAVSEILEAALLFQVMSRNALPRTDSPRDADHDS